MNLNRILSLGANATVGILAVLGAATVLFAPIGTGEKILLLALLAIFAGAWLSGRMRAPSMIILALLSVVFIIIINWAGIFNGIDAGLRWIFDANRIPPESVIVCYEDATCKTVHAFAYSAVLLFVIITGFAYTTLLERRLIAWFQHRVGPNRVGPAGLLQPAADAVKLITKEDIVPAGADYPVWFLAPMIKAVPTLIILGVIPFGPDILIPWFGGVWYRIPLGLADPNVGVLWLLGITSVGTYGVVLAGWASNNKYAMLGGLRATAQMISYELSFGLAIAVPVILASSMSVGDIVEAQSTVPILSWFVFQNPLAAAIMIIALIAEVNRSPFDLPEAEQELTAGFMTEYSGMKFALFMMAEYLGMIGVSIIAASMFFGGYHFLLVDQLPILGPLVLGVKVVLCLMGFIWIRATLPRIRYDRLMMFGWKIMLPLALVAVSWTSIAVVIGDTFQSPFVYLVISGVMFIAVVGGALYFLSRGQQEQDEDDALEDDPMITGEQRGLGHVALQVVGGLLAVPFALVSVLAWALDVVRKLGESPSKELVEDKQSGGD